MHFHQTGMCLFWTFPPKKKVLFEEVLNVMAQAMPQAPWFEICCSSGGFSYEAVDRLEAESEEFSCLEKSFETSKQTHPNFVFDNFFRGAPNSMGHPH